MRRGPLRRAVLEVIVTVALITGAQASEPVTISGLPAGAGLGGSAMVPPGFTLTGWKTDDGLPQMTPKAITQTRDGYLWVGTFNGLSRFDGVRFTPFTINNTPELVSDDITQLFEDSSGILWIGTSDGGLTRYSNGRFAAVPGPKNFSRMTVYSMCEDAKGTVWVGT